MTRSHAVPAGRRVTLNIAGEDPSPANNAIATQVISTQPILVERAQDSPFTPDRCALYADSQGVVFAAGTNALATRLP